MPYIDISTIDNQAKIIAGPRTVTDKTAPTRARQWVRPGDVLVSMTRPNLNAVAIVPPALDGSVASTGFHVLRAVGIEPKWVFMAVQSQDFIEAMSGVVQGVVYPAVRPRDVRNYDLPLAPLPEQQRVVEGVESCSTRLVAAVATLERVKANLKRYRASVLKAAVEGRLVLTEAALASKEGRSYEPASVLLERILKERRRRWEEAELVKLKTKGGVPKNDRWKQRYEEPVAPDTSILPELPEGWCWASADQVSGWITDGEHITPPRSREGVLLLSARNVLDGRVSLDKVDYVPEDVYRGIAKRLTIEPGDVLLSCSGTVGRSCVVPLGLRFTLVRSVAVLKSLLGMGAYVSYCLRSLLLQDQIHRKKTQTAQSNIFQGKIKTLALPIPSLAEQVRIVQEIDDKFSLADAIERSIEINLGRCRRLRQSILKWALEGKLADQDHTDKPASILLDRIKAEREKLADAVQTQPHRRGKRKTTV